MLICVCVDMYVSVDEDVCVDMVRDVEVYADVDIDVGG